MKPISEISQQIVNVSAHIESPIEAHLLIRMARDPRFVLVKDGEPQGEGLFIYPQSKVGPYRADMLVKARLYKNVHRIWPPEGEAILAVECDGKEFHTTEQDVEYDRKREDYFRSNGIETIRFSGRMIYANPDYCIDCVAHQLKVLTGSPW